jgi:hypothetical protein
MVLLSNIQLLMYFMIFLTLDGHQLLFLQKFHYVFYQIFNNGHFWEIKPAPNFYCNCSHSTQSNFNHSLWDIVTIHAGY